MKIRIDAEIAVRILSVAEALDLLAIHLEKRKKRVHSMQKAFGCLMGCNIDLTEIKKRIKLCKDGETLLSDTVGGHGVVFRDTNDWLFLETDRDKFDALKKLKRIK